LAYLNSLKIEAIEERYNLNMYLLFQIHFIDTKSA